MISICYFVVISCSDTIQSSLSFTEEWKIQYTNFCRNRRYVISINALYATKLFNSCDSVLIYKHFCILIKLTWALKTGNSHQYISVKIFDQICKESNSYCTTIDLKEWATKRCSMTKILCQFLQCSPMMMKISRKKPYLSCMTTSQKVWWFAPF